MGVTLRWPHGPIDFVNPADDDDTPWSTLTLTEASRRTAGQVDEAEQ